ncbi:hypothetical protein AAHC03_017106 [Spirometra sp. Aus1]
MPFRGRGSDCTAESHIKGFGGGGRGRKAGCFVLSFPPSPFPPSPPPPPPSPLSAAGGGAFRVRRRRHCTHSRLIGCSWQRLQPTSLSVDTVECWEREYSPEQPLIFSSMRKDTVGQTVTRKYTLGHTLLAYTA